MSQFMNSGEVRIYGVLGDTHLKAQHFPRRLWDSWITRGIVWEEVLTRIKELWGEIHGIFHTGDIAHPDVLSTLKSSFGVPVVAVRGNADRGKWAEDLPNFLKERILGHSIALIHGWGSPRYLIDRIAHRIGWGEYRAVIFGHSHQPLLHTLEGTLWLNPGSPTDCRFAPYRSVARLIVTREGVRGEILRLD